MSEQRFYAVVLQVWKSTRIVMPLVFIIGYKQILIMQVLMPLKEDKAILRNSIIGASVGLLMNVLLVGTMQSVGSALVWVASEIAVLLSAPSFLTRQYHIHFDILFLTLDCPPI